MLVKKPVYIFFYMCHKGIFSRGWRAHVRTLHTHICKYTHKHTHHHYSTIKTTGTHTDNTQERNGMEKGREGCRDGGEGDRRKRIALNPVRRGEVGNGRKE